MIELRLRPLVAVMSLVVLTSPSWAVADSVYLKNGRVIRTALARIERDRVVFMLYGDEQSIPLTVVERVIDDDHVGPAAIGRSPRSGGRSVPSPRGGSAPGSFDRVAPSPIEATSPSPRSRPQPGRGDARVPLERPRGFTLHASQESAPLLPSGIAGLEGIAGLDDITGLDGIAGLLGPESLGALSGLLGNDPGALGGLLGSVGMEMEGIDKVLPLLPRLMAAFQRPIDSEDGVRGMLDELLGTLAELGVSRADIMARARQYGVPEELLEGF